MNGNEYGFSSSVYFLVTRVRYDEMKILEWQFYPMDVFNPQQWSLIQGDKCL